MLLNIRTLTLLVLVFGLVSEASTQSDSISVRLDSIVITADRTGRSTSELLSSGQTVNMDGVTKQLGSTIFPLLQNVPGVFISNESNMAQDVRISVRGFGARSAFGIRGIKLIVDGVPETTPDGQGQVDNLDPFSIQSIAIIKSPSASQFGNASAAVIQINTYRSFDRPFVNMSFRADQYGSSKYIVDAGIKSGKADYLLTVSHLNGVGFREHSESIATIFNLRSKYTFDAVNPTELRWQLSYTDTPRGRDAGAVTSDLAMNESRQARSANVQFDADEAIKHWRASSQFKKIFPNFSLETSAYLSNRIFIGRLGFLRGGWIEFDRFYSGHSTQLSFYHADESISNKLVIGYEVAFQRDKRIRSNNVNGSKGDLTLDQLEKFDVYSIYLADQLSIGKFELDAGLRIDYTALGIDDSFLTDGDDSARRNVWAWSPSVAIAYPMKGGKLFLNYHRSFELPTLTELGNNPSGVGGFNPDLSPQIAHSFEIGTRMGTYKIRHEHSLYLINTIDEFIPFELPGSPGRFFFRNAGKTRRIGLESSLSLRVNKRLEWSISGAISEMKFTEYIAGNNNLQDNTLSGIPQQQMGSRLLYQRGLIDVSASYQLTGGIYADDMNTVKTNPQHLLDLNFSKEFRFGSNIRVEAYFGFRNLLGQYYFDNIRLNAAGGNYFEVGPGRRWDAGITLKL